MDDSNVKREKKYFSSLCSWCLKKCKLHGCISDERLQNAISLGFEESQGRKKIGQS